MEIDRFFSLIKLKGVSQTHLCSLVDRSRHYLQDVRAGKSTPPEHHIRVWAEALDTTYEYLMGYSNEQNQTLKDSRRMFHANVKAQLEQCEKQDQLYIQTLNAVKRLSESPDGEEKLQKLLEYAALLELSDRKK